MTKVAVIILLSSKADIGTEVEPFWAMVLLFIDTYFERFWWKFINNCDMILCFSTRFTMQCLNFNSASLTAPNSNSTFLDPLRPISLPITMRQAFCCGKSCGWSFERIYHNQLAPTLAKWIQAVIRDGSFLLIETQKMPYDLWLIGE